MKKSGAKIWIIVVAVVVLLGIAAGVLFATGVFSGKSTIKTDFNDIYFEFGKKINLPDTTVFDGAGREIAYDSVCVAMVAPDGTEVDIASGFVTPMQEGFYTLTYRSASTNTETEIKVECRDTIDPTLSVEIQEAYLIKEKYEDTEYTVHTLPIISADDLAGIDAEKTEVKITVGGKEVPLNGDQFTITEEGALVFSFTVYDLNGRSTTVVKESLAELPEYFDTYCLSTFAKDTYLTKLCGGWLKSYYEASILESDTDPSGNTQEGVLKITYDTSDVEAAACIHLARPVKLEDAEYLAVTLRLEDAYFTAEIIDAIFYKADYREGFWTITNVSATVGSSYKTIYIGKTQLESFVEDDGYIRQFQIETFGDGKKARSIYIADVSYGPKGSVMPENSAVTNGNTGANGGTTGNIADDFPKYCLSTFSKQAYKNHMCGGWMNSKFSSTILSSDTDPSGKTMEGVVKITYPASDKEAGACIHFGRAVKRSEVKSIEITLRIENGYTTAGGTVDAVFYKSNYKEGFWTTSNVSAYVGKNYITISIGEGPLNQMMDSDGYIRQFQIETFGDGKTARSIYIADISYTPVVVEPDEPVIPDLPELAENCMSAFDSEGYLQMLCGGWMNSEYQAVILERDTDPSNVTKEGVLKITYPVEDREAGACIHLAKAVKRDEIKAMQVTLRMENNAKTGGIYDAIFYKADYKDGYWTISNVASPVGSSYVTVTIGEGTLNAMADADGYIRKIQIETFGDGKVARSIYIADISYTPVNAEPENPDEPDVPDVPDVPELPELSKYCMSAFDSEGYLQMLCGGWINSKYEAVILERDTDPSNVVKQGVLKITYPVEDREAGACIHLAKAVKRDEIKAMQVTLRMENNAKTGGIYDAIFYKADYKDGYWTISNVASPVGSSYVTVTIGEGTLNAMADADGYIRKIQIETFGDGKVARSIYIADISYTPVNAEPENPDEPTEPPVTEPDPTEPTPSGNLAVSGVGGQNPNQLMMSLPVDPNVKVGTKMTVQSGLTVTIDGVDYGTTQNYDFWWNGTAWTTEEVKPDQTLEITSIKSFSARNTIYLGINAAHGKSLYGNMTDICNEESHILINDQAWSGTQELCAFEGQCFYIGKIGAEQGTKITIKQGFTMTANGTKYVTDKDYNYWWDGTVWTTEEVAKPEPELPELPENCLSAFNGQQYLDWVCGGWLNSNYEATILESDTDSANVTKEGVLKITYPVSDREAGACIHLAQPVKREDVKSMQVTLRIENAATTAGGTVDAIFYKANYYDGYWSTSTTSVLVGKNYVTITIGEGPLNQMTDSDGYIRQLQIETFGDGKVARSIYIADVSYTPVNNEPVDPDPTDPPDTDNELIISGSKSFSGANTLYYSINVDTVNGTGLSNWYSMANVCNEETHILINDLPWTSTQEICAFEGKCFYIGKIGGKVGTKITVKKGFTMTLNGTKYVTKEDYTFWYNGSAWTTEEVETTE